MTTVKLKVQRMASTNSAQAAIDGFVSLERSFNE
jgi:hypothetical protein